MKLESELRVGLIQPIIDPDVYWNHTKIFEKAGKKAERKRPFHLNIKPRLAEKVWQEIQYGVNSLLYDDIKPHIILIPELHLPPARVSEIKAISKQHNVMIIAGVDFQRHPLIPTKIRNRAIVTIPSNWPNKPSRSVSALYIGKTYFTYMEDSMFRNIEGVVCEKDMEPNMYVFKQKELGNFGVMICSDIFDIERMMLYQSNIHHLFIISLNKDLNTYFSMTESLAQLIYCNVVVCNTGFYGGSVAISPYRDSNKRLIYKYQGQRMFNVHMIKLPVEEMDLAQRRDYSIPTEEKPKFKASPPGFYQRITG